MSILIKGMEMPSSCFECCFYIESYDGAGVYECAVTGTKSCKEMERHFDCPLVPVPSHGRLIDGDAFEEFIRKDWDKNDHWIAEVVYSRPTIIEAEESLKEATND